MPTYDRVAAGENEVAVGGPDLLTAEEAAVLLRVGRKFIYAHAHALGGWRLLGDRGPWRFSRSELLAHRPAVPRIRPHPTRASRGVRGREQARTPAGAPLLPAEPRREAR
ncbi:MAG: helix-turn-helix domain-containing protein [Solirubrobacteraceae bacterium]